MWVRWRGTMAAAGWRCPLCCRAQAPGGELFARAVEAGKEVSGMLEAAACAPELKGMAFIPLPQLILARFLFPPTAAGPIFATNAVKSVCAVPGKNARFRHKTILLHQ
jgi:hypothetical protein